MRSAVRTVVATLVYLSIVAAQNPAAQGPGDTATGKLLFEGKGRCLTCHTVNDAGGSLGPDLSWIGILRSPESLTRSLVDPGEQISRRYFTLVVETKDGKKLEGLTLNEDDFSIQIRDTQGELKSFRKDDLKELRREPRSLMPSYATELSGAEVAHLVAYLRTLRKMWALEPGPSDREIAPTTENVPFFNRPERDTEERPEQLIGALQIRPGATVADIGSGTGYFTWRLAEAVGPEGKVYAVDVQQSMLDLTKAAVDSHRLRNVEYVLATETSPRLPEGSVDLAFLAYAYHEFADPEATMRAIRRALKPGGRVLVLEYAKESKIAPASPLHKMSFEEIRREIEPMGFAIDQLLDFLPVQHGVVFTVNTIK
jgi:putative heme-binding domain-containing protein